MSSTKPDILMACGTCGCNADDMDRCPNEDCPRTAKAYVALDDLPERVVEDLRGEHLQANTIDATAEDLGPAPPGIKPPDEQIKAELRRAFENPLGGEDDKPPPAPSDVLG